MTHTTHVEFIWNGEKDKANRKKHGIAFIEATNAFQDPFSISRPDKEHEEDRIQLLGNMDHDGYKILFVVYIEDVKMEGIRIISARRATRKERVQYGRGYF